MRPNDRSYRILSRLKQAGAIANRRRLGFRIADLSQLRIPMFDEGAIGRHATIRDRQIAIFGITKKRCFTWQRKRRGPIRRKPHKTRLVKIKRENGIAIGAIQMQTKKSDAERSIEEKVLIAALHNEEVRGSKISWQLSKFSLFTCLQIP